MEDALEGSVIAARRLSDELDSTQRNTRDAARAAGDFESSLKELERAAGRLNTETASMALSAGRAEGNFQGLAGALSLSEDDARRLAGSILEAQAAANRIQDSALQTARSLGLSEDEAARFAASMNRAARETRSADEAAAPLASRFDSIRGSVLGLVAGFGAFAAVRGIIRGLDELVDSFVAFDQAINQSLAIVANVTPEIRNQFEAVARTVSTTLRFSAAEAGEAFFFLASAGFDVQQQLAALPRVAQFAQAGMFDLSRATTLLADSQTALGLRMKDPIANMRELTRVSDVLTRANILSNAEVEQFAEALTNRAASAARTVGVELEEVVAVLAAFADQGLKGEAAGEAFAIVLRDLQTAALRNEDDFKRFGVSVFDAVGEIRPLADVVADLENAFDGLSDAQTRQALIDLGFQDRSVSNLLVLLGTSEAIREYTRELRNASGATEELANNQLLSLGSRLEIAGNKIENAKIALGESLVPAIEAFVAILPGLIEQVTNLAPALESVAVSFGNAAPAAASFLGEIIRFIEATPRSIGILVNLGQVIGDVAGIVTGTTAIEAGLAGDLTVVNDALGSIRDNVRDIQFSRLEQGLQDAIRGGEQDLAALANTLRELDDAEGGTSLAAISRLARTAGVDGKRLEIVLAALLADAKGLGLSATQVQQFGIALVDLGRADGPIRNISHQIAALPTEVELAVTRLTHAVDPISTFFFELNPIIEETGLTFAELILDADGAASHLLAVLEPADRLGLTLQALARDTELAGESFARSLTASFADASQALTDFNEDGKVSIAEFIRGLEESALATGTFATNIARIFAVSPELAAAIEALPREAGALLAAGFAKNPQRILEANDALLGTSTGLADTIRTLVTQAMGFLQSGDFAGLEQFTAFVSTLDIPGATQAIADQLNEALPSAFDLLNIPSIDLSETGSESAASYVLGFQEELASREDDIRDAVERTTRSGLQIDSPSKVMMRLGEFAGQGLIDGFLRVANQSLPVLTGIQIGGGAVGAAAGNVSTINVNNTINHPISPNLLTDIAQLDQTTGAAAAGLRAF